ncbi:MAG TPA: Uma2 family endonuclease [Myxococcales bacterium]
MKVSEEENRYELVRGDLLMMTPATPVHGRFAGRLSHALMSHLEEHDLGEVYVSEPGFLLQPEPDAIVRAPDVAFVRKERIPPRDQQAGFWPIAPDLAVEIISPSEGAAEIQAKVQDYLKAGVRLVWLVYPEIRSVIEYRSGGQVRQLEGDACLDGGDVLPGFSYRLTSLFK